MLTLTLVRCLSIFLVLLFMCPKGTHLSASIGQRYFRAMGAPPHPKFGRAFKAVGMVNRKPLKLLLDKNNVPAIFDTTRKTPFYLTTHSSKIYPNNSKRWTTFEGYPKRPSKWKYDPHDQTYKHTSSDEKTSSQNGKKWNLEFKPKIVQLSKENTLSQYESDISEESDVSEENDGVTAIVSKKPVFFHIPKDGSFNLLPSIQSPEFDGNSNIPLKLVQGLELLSSAEKDTRIESGFDLTPEEMEKFKIWENAEVPYYIDVISFKGTNARFVSIFGRGIHNLMKQQLLYDQENFSGTEPGFDLSTEEIDKFKLWLNAEVPYYIDVVSFKDKVLRDQIRWMLSEVNSLTRLNFVELPRPPADDETRWVLFVNRIGQLTCSDHSIQYFNTTGVQRVVLGYECMSTGRELAEAVLAIAGVPPQHNSPDRDQYIKVNIENVIPGKEYLFEKIDDKDWLFHNTGYDYESAGHFDTHKHSVNGKATIEFRPPHSQSTVREQRGLSNNDIWKISMLYNFISTKNKGKEPACSKLFSPGENINNVRDPFQKKSIPRPKSNKYLGIEDVEKTLKDYDVQVEEYSGPDGPSGANGADGEDQETDESDNSNNEPRVYPCKDSESCNNNTNKEQYDEKSNSEGYAEFENNGIHDDEGFHYDENTADESEKMKLKLKRTTRYAHLNPVLTENNKDKLKLKQTTPRYQHPDPLLYLSDYNTDNELYERSGTKKIRDPKASNRGSGWLLNNHS